MMVSTEETKLRLGAQLIQENSLKMQVKKLIVPRFHCHIRSIHSVSHLECMAGTTGLEPATSAVTGQRSNQLNYVPTCFSYGQDPTRMVTVTLALNRFACFNPFHRIEPVFEKKWPG
jgi:hypothetical protein